MRAFVYTRYGPPEMLSLEEVDTPVAGPGEVLVRVHAVSINAGDWRLLRADPFLVRLMFGLFRPKLRILGSDVAGRVEAAGSGVTRFQIGDAVLGDVSAHGFGAFAEYVRAPEDAFAAVPEGVSLEDAAAAPMAAVTSLQALRDRGGVQSGQRVLINGAAGGVGTFAVQLAKHFGARVTAVCSARNAEQAREIGAENVIDYTREDFTRGEDRYDLIIGVNGHQSIFDYRRVLAPGGVYALIGGGTKQFLQASLLGPVLSRLGDRKFLDVLARPNHEDLAFVAGLLQTGALKAVIDRRYPFEELPEAIRYVEGGHARGKVVVTVADAA